jgi:hypothetical protein
MMPYALASVDLKIIIFRGGSTHTKSGKAMKNARYKLVVGTHPTITNISLIS